MLLSHYSASHRASLNSRLTLRVDRYYADAAPNNHGVAHSLLQ